MPTGGQHALVGDIRRHAGAALDDDSLLFVAQWVGRRLQQNSRPDHRPRRFRRIA